MLIESTECENADEVKILKAMIMDTFKKNRRNNLSNYWLNQVRYVAYKWNRIANEVENQVALM